MKYNKRSLISISTIIFPLFLLFASSCGGEESQSPSSEIELIKIENISFEDKEVTYDGTTHSIEISGELPQDVTVKYTNNYQINAGIYEITAQFVGDETKYVLPDNMEATLTINKAVFDTSDLIFEDAIVEYNGNEQSIFVVGNLPKGVSVSYTNNQQVEVGSYEVTANFVQETPNYFEIEPLKANLTIVKAGEMPVLFESETFSYDGLEKSIYIEGKLPEGVSVSYVNNAQTQPGTYEVIATFTSTNPNYADVPSKKATLTIVKDGKYHDVEYYQNGIKTSQEVVKSGEILTTLPELPQEKIGYTNMWFYGNQPILQDMVISSGYVPNAYKITYDPQGGTISSLTQNVLFDSAYELQIPEKEGFTFKGWKLGEEYFEKEELWTRTQDIYLTATWFDNNAPKYKINYYFDGELIKTDTVIYGDFYSVYDVDKEKEEHIFVSWKNGDMEFYENEVIEFFYESDIDLFANNILDHSYFDYEIKGNDITIIEYTGSQKHLVLTDTLKVGEEYYNVIAIDDNAFYDCDVIESITIPSSIESVGKYTFIDCDNLVEIIVDENNETYDSRDNCNAIIETGTGTLVASCKSTTIPSTASVIGEGAFYNTLSEKITIASGIHTIEKYAFANSRKLIEVQFAKNSLCGTIEEGAFQSCSNLSIVEIPERTIFVGEGVFAHSAIDKVYFKGKLEQWCSISFYDSSANPINNGAKLYINNELLEELVVPKTVKAIGSSAFAGYKYLTSINFEEGSQCVSIAKNAFYQCENVFVVFLPSSIEKIETLAFSGGNIEAILCESESRPSAWSRYWVLSTVKVVWGTERRTSNELFDKHDVLLQQYKKEKVNYINGLSSLDEDFKKEIITKIQKNNIYEVCVYIDNESIIENVVKTLQEKIDYQVAIADIQENENAAKLSYLKEWFGGKFIEINPATNKEYLSVEQIKEATDKYLEIIQKYDWTVEQEKTINELKELYEKEVSELKEAMKPYEDIYIFETKKVSANTKFNQAKEDFLSELEKSTSYSEITEEIKEAIISLVDALEIEDLSKFESLDAILVEEERVYNKLDALKIIAEQENAKKAFVALIEETIKEEFYLKVSTKEYTAIKEEVALFIQKSSPINLESVKNMNLVEKINALKALTKENAEKTYDKMGDEIDDIIKKYNLIIEVRDYSSDIVIKINANSAKLGADVANDYSYEIAELGEFATIPTTKQAAELIKAAGEKSLNNNGVLSYENTTTGYVGQVNTILKEVLLLIDAMKLKEEAFDTIEAFLMDQDGLNQSIINSYKSKINDLGDAAELYNKIKNSTVDAVISKYKADLNKIVEQAKEHSTTVKDGYEIDYENRIALEKELAQMKTMMGSIDVNIYSCEDDITFSEVTLIIDVNGMIIYAAYTDFSQPSPYAIFYHDGSYEMERDSQSVIFLFSDEFDPYDETQPIDTYEIVIPEGATVVTGRAKQMITVIENVFETELESITDNSFFESLYPGFYDTEITKDIMFDSFTDTRWKEISAEAEKLLETYSAAKGATADEIIAITNKFKKAREEFISNIIVEFKELDQSNFQATLKEYKRNFERIMMDMRNTYMEKDIELLEFREIYKEKFKYTETSYDVKKVFEEFELELAKLISTFN